VAESFSGLHIAKHFIAPLGTLCGAKAGGESVFLRPSLEQMGEVLSAPEGKYCPNCVVVAIGKMVHDIPEAMRGRLIAEVQRLTGPAPVVPDPADEASSGPMGVFTTDAREIVYGTEYRTTSILAPPLMRCMMRIILRYVYPVPEAHIARTVRWDRNGMDVVCRVRIAGREWVGVARKQHRDAEMSVVGLCVSLRKAYELALSQLCEESPEAAS